MTIDWRTIAAAPLASFLEGPGVEKALYDIGLELLHELERAGDRYDVHFPPPPAPSKSSVLVEGPAHSSWRTSKMPGALSSLDLIAASIDGGPATPIDATSAATLEAARAVIVTRLEAIAKSDGDFSPEEVSLAKRALATPLPTEPRFYVDAYYEYAKTLRPPAWWNPRATPREYAMKFAELRPDPSTGLAGEVEGRLVLVVGEVATFLAIVTS